MKKLFYFLVPIMLIISCNDSATDADNNNDTTQNLEDPALVQPPSENIPDSMRIVNDSVIVTEAGRDTLRR